jgi:preprotein translocase subunit SecF
MPYKSKPIQFMKYYPLYFLISLLVIIPGAYSLIRWGLQPSIDFTGGSLMEFVIPNNPSTQAVREAIPPDIEVSSIQTTTNNSFLIRTKPIDKNQNELLKNQLSQQLGQVTEARFETIGPTLGKELLTKTITAIILSASMILLYMAYRFRNVTFGLAALLAMLHDTFIIIGVFSLLGHFYSVEVDTLFVTALLTILSFSVHDTIVVFDRIRESKRIFPYANLSQLVDKAVNETLTRSINNSMTIIFMLLALWLMGGETTKWFVFALLIGTITGTYSSTFTAAPLLLIFEKYTKSRTHQR